MLIVNFTHHRPSSKIPEPRFPSIPGTFDRYSLSWNAVSSAMTAIRIFQSLELRQLPIRVIGKVEASTDLRGYPVYQDISLPNYSVRCFVKGCFVSPLSRPGQLSSTFVNTRVCPSCFQVYFPGPSSRQA